MRCTLCHCAATEDVYGFPVCPHHVENGEDDAPCPACVLDARSGYRVRIIREEWQYVRSVKDAYDVELDAYDRVRFDGGRVRVEVERCAHENGYAETAPTPRGLAHVFRWTCEDCGETYAESIVHDTYARTSANPFRPHVGTDGATWSDWRETFGPARVWDCDTVDVWDAGTGVGGAQ